MANLVAIHKGYAASVQPINRRRAIMVVAGTSSSAPFNKILRAEGVDSRDVMTSSSTDESYVLLELTIRRALPMIPQEYKALCDEVVTACLLAEARRMRRAQEHRDSQHKTKGGNMDDLLKILNVSMDEIFDPPSIYDGPLWR